RACCSLGHASGRARYQSWCRSVIPLAGCRSWQRPLHLHDAAISRVEVIFSSSRQPAAPYKLNENSQLKILAIHMSADGQVVVHLSTRRREDRGPPFVTPPRCGKTGSHSCWLSFAGISCTLRRIGRLSSMALEIGAVRAARLFAIAFLAFLAVAMPSAAQ